MDIKKGYFVKTYDLCDGRIEIGRIDNIINEDKIIDCWSGCNALRFRNEEYITFEKNTIIWNKKKSRWVFYYANYGEACFSTIVVDVSEYLESLLIDNEKVIYHFD